jgi:hypothetical protein
MRAPISSSLPPVRPRRMPMALPTTRERATVETPMASEKRPP